MPALNTMEVEIPPDSLEGTLTMPDKPRGLVIFAHGSGSSRLSPRNTAVARELNSASLATLLFDLLSPHEADDRDNVFDIQRLSRRLQDAINWCRLEHSTRTLPVGLFGASTGAAAALAAAAALPDQVSTVVSRGGRPDLAAEALPGVRAPTLLIVGEDDRHVLRLNERALAQMRCQAELVIVPGASHLFEEPGTLETVVNLARDWFLAHFHNGSRP